MRESVVGFIQGMGALIAFFAYLAFMFIFPVWFTMFLIGLFE